MHRYMVSVERRERGKYQRHMRGILGGYRILRYSENKTISVSAKRLKEKVKKISYYFFSNFIRDERTKLL